ncbi:hypothetical protein GCM10009872_03540 [Actinopolymorpha rutila]
MRSDSIGASVPWKPATITWPAFWLAVMPATVCWALRHSASVGPHASGFESGLGVGVGVAVGLGLLVGVTFRPPRAPWSALPARSRPPPSPDMPQAVDMISRSASATA